MTHVNLANAELRSANALQGVVNKQSIGITYLGIRGALEALARTFRLLPFTANALPLHSWFADGIRKQATD